MIDFIDRRLNTITMYRLVLYYVSALLVAAFILGFFGDTPEQPMMLAFSGALITAVCWAVNRAFAALFQVPVNTESIYITAIILALIMPPIGSADTTGMAGLALAAAAATASKFLFAIRRRHIFNPVAVGVTASAFLLDQPATWWVGGNLAMLPLVLAGGLLVVRKVQRFDMISGFILANLAVALALAGPGMQGEAITQAMLYSPLLFAGFAMLTEPLTAPAAQWPRILYGGVVGGLSAANVHVGAFYFTPEVAFLAGNALAFAMSPQPRVKLTLIRIEKMAQGCFDYVFAPDRQMAFAAGQYLDWTLDVRHPDDRGNRRPFTIASAPGENDVRLGVKFYKKPSAFKRTLLAMQPGDSIYGSHIAGNFTMPRDRDEKLAFIAGGIGVTPFRSMIQDLVDTKHSRDVVMLYGNNTAEEIAYTDVFNRAEHELGIRTIYAVAEEGPVGANLHRGFIDAALIASAMPDYMERTFYVSGPRSMVTRFQGVLSELGVRRSRIRVDFFPGLA
jgi:glycine betaine catabolism B